METIHPDIEKVLLTEDQIHEIVTKLGDQITKDYEGKNPLIVCVLRGAFIFTADLIRAIKVPCEVDFMAVSSYGSESQSSGVVRITKDLSTKIEGRDVIITEDILDSGLTLSYLYDLLKARNPKSIRICVFAIKDIPNKKAAIKPDYLGITVPNAFIVGYGLDYAEKYRNLLYLGVLKPEVYSSQKD